MSTAAQLQEVRERLAQLNPMDRNHMAEIQSLKAQEAELVKAAAQEETAAELKAQHEERVKESVEQIYSTFDSVDIEGFSLRELFLDEARYQLASIWIKKQFEEQAATFSKQIQAEQLENKQLREEVNEQERIISALKDEVHQVTLERDQAISYRDNAHAQLEEARKEVTRLNEHVDTLRVEAAVGAKNAYKVTNLDGAKEWAEKIRASLIPVTEMGPADLLGKQFRVVLAETGEEKIVGFLEKGKYRLVDAQEAAEVAERFRAEQAAQERVEESAESNPALVDEPELPSFPVPTQDNVPGVDGLQQSTGEGAVGGDGEAVEDVSLESLAKRVKALEDAVYTKAQGAA